MNTRSIIIKIIVESSAGVAKKKLKNSMNKKRIQNSGIH